MTDFSTVFLRATGPVVTTRSQTFVIVTANKERPYIDSPRYGFSNPNDASAVARAATKALNHIVFDFSQCFMLGVSPCNLAPLCPIANKR